MKRLPFSGFILVLSIALSPGTTRADDLADEADVQFELGAKKYQAGDYLGALEHFLVSNRLVPNKNVLFNIARCYEQLHRYPDAYRAYERALAAETTPAGKKNIEASIANIAPKVAILEVTTDPPGATVYLDRKDLGPRGDTPRKLGLDKGKYKVIVERAGYEPASTETSVEIGQESKIHLKLEPILTTLVLEGEEGATVRLDDASAAPLCTIPCSTKIAPGHHVLHVTREGFKKAEIPVDLAPKSKTTVRARLDVVTGTVVVNADVQGALVEVDGKPYNFAPTVLQVPVGKHTLTISRSGFKAVTQPVVVKKGEQTRVDATLTEVSEVNAASRAQESVEDAPSSVSIVPSVELRGMGYPTIGEAVRGVRGVYLTDDRHYLTVGFRGFSNLGDYGNRVLVLVDGHPTNDDYIGSSFVGYEGRTDLEDVERIEVVRGPGSVLYGTGAFFGVINLVTRSRGMPSRVEAQVSAVDEAVARARVAANQRFGEDAGVWMSFGAARGFGKDLYFPEFASDPATGGIARGLDTFDAGTAQGRFWWKAFTVQWLWTERKKTLPTGAFETVFGDPRTTFRDRRAFLEARFEPKVSDTIQLFSRAHANVYDFRGTYAYQPVDGGLSVEAFTGDWVGFEQRVEVAATQKLKLTVGGEVQKHFKTHQTSYDETSVILDRTDPFTVGAGYLVADLVPSRAVKISAGARYDWYSLFGGALNPRAAVILKPTTSDVVKLLGGTAFRAPSVYELYHSDGTQRAAENLSPERVRSGELEVSHRFSPLVVGTVAAWGNYVTDLVVQAGAGTTDDPTYYRNLEKPILTTGLDFELRRDFRDGWMIAAQTSVQRARYLQNDDHLYREVPNSPNVLGSVRGSIPILARALTLTSRLSYLGPRWDKFDRATDLEPQGHTQAALIWDLVFTGEAERTGIRYGIGVYNAFDWRYTAPVSRELTQRSMIQQGRTLFASLTLTI